MAKIKKEKHNLIITANNISFEVSSGFSILKNISISFDGEKSGLVGKNGTGKTTLLRLFVGEIQPSKGKIYKTGKVAYLPQDYHFDLNQSVSDFFDITNKKYIVEAKLEQLNLKNLDMNRTLSSLSGGERTKVIFAKLLISDPDFIILDEPTNNLDHSSREIIYEFTKKWQRGLLVVSHDRNLLNLVDRILELSNKGLKSYGGDYDNYKKQKALEDSAAERQLTYAEQEFKKIKKQAQKTKQGQEKRSQHGKKIRDKTGMSRGMLGRMKETSETTSSRLRKLHERRIEGAFSELEKAKEKISPENAIKVDLSGTEVHSGKLVVELKNMKFSYERSGKLLFDNFNLVIYGPARFAINGPNGSGKTTLVKLILKEIEPLGGEISLGLKRFAYLDQNISMLDRDKTLLENLKNISGLDDNFARKWLARFLFRDRDAFKKVETFSGGEKMRAALACILAGDAPPNLLVLDEPTNNLDLNSIEQIESALLNFQGALIVISHDKSFLESIKIEEELAL